MAMRISAADIRTRIAGLEAILYAPETPRDVRADVSMELSELRWELGRRTGRRWSVDEALDTPEEE